jgi:oligoendopeptidase F
VDSQNNKIKALYTKYDTRLTEAANNIVFFNLALAKISKDNQKKFLQEPLLAPYRTYLTSIFDVARYNLSEAEEKIINLKSGPAYDMWVKAQSKLLTSQTVAHRGKQIPITQAQAIKADLPIKERRALHLEIIKKYKEISFFAEAEINAVVTNKRINDDLRGMKSPYEATVIQYQNSLESVDALVAVVTRYAKDSNRFFKLKAKVLGLPKLTFAEIGTKMSKSKKKYSIEEGVQYVYNAFKEAKPQFAELFTSFIEQGRFDFLPKAGKRNGAYCSSGVGVPTYILLNHIDDMNSIFTMAHEMGHAIHSELSKQQVPIYEDYSMSIAEVASTFFENILFDYLFARANDTERTYMLLEKVQDDIFTTYSQIGYFNFEAELHNQIRERGQLSAEEIATMLLKHRKVFFGNAFEYHPHDGYSFIATPHFRYFFYVYSYAYGQLIANALYAEYKNNPQFIDKIEQFLSAGSSMRPDDVFASIGIDVTKPEFFEKGLQQIADRITEAEKLYAKISKKK